MGGELNNIGTRVRLMLVQYQKRTHNYCKHTDWTHCVGWGSHVYVYPHSIIVKPEMSTYEQASTRALGIGSILQQRVGEGGLK